MTHLGQVGLFSGSGVVVDLGWHATLQRSLAMLGREFAGAIVDLSGVYIRLFKPRATMGEGDPMRTDGRLFDDEPLAAQAVIRRTVEVIELLFSAPQGGIRFVEMADGRPRPVRTVDEEEVPRLRIASLLHDLLERSCTALRPLAGVVAPEESKAQALGALDAFLSSPRCRNVEVFCQITHAKGFGVARYQRIVPAMSRRSGRWVIEVAYNESFWRAAFWAGLDPLGRLALVSKEKRPRKPLKK